jgi:hypothetical protein
MFSSRPSSPRRVSGFHVAVIAGLALLMLVPTGTVGTPRASSPDLQISSEPAASSFSATVTWNGVNVNTAGSAASALSVDFSNSANVLFNWTTPTGAVNPNDARLQMIYFGFALATRDVVNSGNGGSRAVLNWTPGALVYVLEGVYEITASLVAPDGSTVWSENFFVHSTAPFSIGAVLPIVLIVIIIWELYSVATSGRQVLLSKRGKAPPSKPEEPTPTTPEEPAGSEPSTPPGEAAPSGPEEPK